MSDGFSPPQQVRANAKRSLELRKKHGRGMTAVGVARARDLSNGKSISADTIKRMVSYFARHEVDKKGEGWGKDSAGYIAWLGWGGDAGRAWANKINRQLNAKESEEISESMASSKAAIIRGIFIKPGVSKNRRMYTRENIGKAVERMKQQLASGDGMPITMATSHGAAFKDDALSTVGRVTKVEQLADGSAAFEAEIANTTQGRDVAALATGKFIKGVSIRGEWMGNLETKQAGDGEEAVTAPDLKILGIDFTHSPGVEGAEIQYAALAESFASDSQYNIIESTEPVEIIARDETLVANETASLIMSAVEAAVESALEAQDSKKPYGDVKYADPGYQKDKKKRYPIDTAAHVRAAWSYINQKDNAGQYSSAQLARVKSRIKSAAKKFGIEIQEEYNSLIADFTEILEAYASTTFAANLATDEISGVDIAENIKLLASKLTQAATLAINFLDQDVLAESDEDLAVEMDDDGDDDSSTSAGATRECHECGCECANEAKFCHECGAMLEMNSTPADCANCGNVPPADAMYCPNCGHNVPQAESNDEALTQTEENKVSEEITTPDVASAEESGLDVPAARTLSDADIQALAVALAATMKPTENTSEEPAAEVVEPEVEEPAEAPAEEPAAEEEEEAAEEATESQENIVTDPKMFSAEEVAAMVAEAATKAASEAVAAAQKSAIESYRTGRVFRKGLVAESTGTDASDMSDAELTPEALSEMNSAQFRQVQSEVWGSTPFFAAKFAQAERGF